MTDQDMIAWETAQARRILDLVYTEVDFVSELGCFIERIYLSAYPHLVLSRHGNPIHHTAHVVNNLFKICQGEHLMFGQMQALLAAAIYHDAGFEIVDPHEKKIKMAEIEPITDPLKKAAKCEEARIQRISHGHHAARLFEREVNPNWFHSKQAFNDAARIIEKHDWPTVAELVSDSDKKAWLFNKSQSLEMIHREADRLWMLTVNGVIADLRTDGKTGILLELVRAKLAKNAKRHKEEGNLYWEFMPESDRLVIYKDCGFYYTSTGRKLFQTMPKETEAFFESFANLIQTLPDLII